MKTAEVYRKHGMLAASRACDRDRERLLLTEANLVAIEKNREPRAILHQPCRRSGPQSVAAALEQRHAKLAVIMVRAVNEAVHVGRVVVDRARPWLRDFVGSAAYRSGRTDAGKPRPVQLEEPQFGRDRNCGCRAPGQP